jgi:K+/H+ antiporter YhaU regulatory subunit KhtT
VVAILRGDAVVRNPGPEYVLEAGDRLGVIGTPAQRRRFGALLAPDAAADAAPLDAPRDRDGAPA